MHQYGEYIMKHYLLPFFVLTLTTTTEKLSASALNLQGGFQTPAQSSISITIEQHSKDLKEKRKEEKRKHQNTDLDHITNRDNLLSIRLD